MVQVFVNVSPGWRMVPSGTVSPSRLALKQPAFGPVFAAGADVGLGAALGAGEVAEAASGTSGVDEGAAACVFCAATVSATAVAMAESLAPHAERTSERSTSAVGILTLRFIRFLSGPA
jgi:hypothetical protein